MIDKLRAIQYFVSAAEEGSFAGAARRLEVSVPAVQKLLGTLERQIGIILFERNAKGVKLTGNVLVIRGKIFGAMPMVAKVRPAEARAALKLLDAKTIFFLLTLLFRRG